MEEQRFTDNVLKWNDRRLDGVRRGADKAMGAAMGGTARSGLDTAVARNRKTADNPNNKDAVRRKADLGAKTAQKIGHVPEVQDQHSTVSNISRNYANQFTDLVGQAAESGASAIPGTGWYYDHRRGAEAALPSGHGLASRQVAAMSAKLSAGKTPDDERESMSGIHELVSKHSNATVDGHRVSDIPASDLAAAASSEAAWHSHAGGAGRSGRPSTPRPTVLHAGEHHGGAQDALRRAGRAHEDNIAPATEVARGSITPHEAFKHSTPKTAAYGEMISASNPESVEETDYRSISAHILDTARGDQHPSQGMMLFSKETPGSKPYTLRSDAPTAIDTWMYAAGSGLPASAPNNEPETGAPAKGRDIRVSKRMTDKNMPLDPSTKTKPQMGIAGTPVEVTPIAAASAQHMEAVGRASKKLGPVSFDQHGQDIHVPSSLIQETVWTEHRRQAGADPVHNAAVRDTAKSEKADAKAADAAAKSRAKAQGSLF